MYVLLESDNEGVRGRDLPRVFVYTAREEPEAQVAATKKVVQALPYENRRILKRIFHLFLGITANCAVNKVIAQR